MAAWGAFILTCVSACGPNLRDERGALAAAADAVAQRDSAALFRVLDQRARFSLDAIVTARRAARQIVEQSYPASEVAAAVAALGDAAAVENGAALFGERCGEPCLSAIGEGIAAPRTVALEGALARITTVRGDTVLLYHADDGSFGLVWHSDELMREKSRAFAELALIKRNAAVYAQKRALK